MVPATQGTQQGGVHSRLGAEASVPGGASNWQSSSGTGGYSTDRLETGSSEAGLSIIGSQETNSKPDHSHGHRPGVVTQRDSGSSTGTAHAAASHSSQSDWNTTQYDAGQATGHSHHGPSAVASEGQRSGYQSGGSSQGYVQQGPAASTAGYGDDSTEAVTRLPSTGIPPVFHAPSYTTSEIPSRSTTDGHLSSNMDSQGVSANQALGPLTGMQTGVVGRETSGVNAKQALEPLTHIAAGDNAEEVGGVHAREALQPLTEVPAQESNKGFVESIKEYLPGQHQAGTVEVSTCWRAPSPCPLSCIFYLGVQGYTVEWQVSQSKFVAHFILSATSSALVVPRMALVVATCCNLFCTIV